MARDIVTFIWCDPCMVDDDRTEGSEHIITIGAKKPRTLALCERHEKELLAPLEAILVEHGQPVHTATGSAPIAPPGPRVYCKFPSCTSRLKNIGSLKAHVRQSHDMSFSNYVAEYDKTLTADESPEVKTPTPFDDIPDEFKCTECDIFYDPALYAKPAQAIGMHKNRSHGISADPKRKSRAKVPA